MDAHVALVLLALIGQAVSVDEYNVPEIVRKCVAAKEQSDITLDARMNPFYLRGNLDGDQRADYAAWVVQKGTGKAGILVCSGNGRISARIGAGASFSLQGGHRTDDLQIFNAWSIEEPDSSFRRDRIHVVAKERGSGLTYFDGRSFKWRQLAE